jgi:hypothetical protein
VDGFLHWVKEKGEHFISVERATKGEGAPRVWAHISLDLMERLVKSFLCIKVPLYCITCCISCFDHHYIEIYPKLAFLEGVLSSIMLTKNTCVKFIHA